MNDERDDTSPSEETSRYFAEKGEAHLDRFQAILERAREMLASGEVDEPAGGIDPHQYHYPWESTQPPDARRRIWRATADDFATGQGLTVHYCVGRARDEDEFRRQIARELGFPLADAAKLGVGLDSDVPFEGMFLSDSLRAQLERFDRGEDPPAGFGFFARYYTNYS